MSTTAIEAIDGLLATELPPNCGEIRVLDYTGDLRIIWDKSKPDEVAHARETFKKFTDRSYAAFHVKRGTGGEAGEKMKFFDPNVERYILVPPVVGG